MRVLEAEIFATAADARGFPAPERPEIAFLGRSNVGKSSLLNKLVNRRALARTSGTPGKTRLIHFYRARGAKAEALLVDLPGYGYAKVSQRERQKWKGMVEGYLDGRRALRAAVLLQDVRRDVSEDESLLIEWLAERAVPVVVALTKTDKLAAMRRTQRVRALQAQLELPAGRIVATSATKGTGIVELWRVLDELAGLG